MLYRLPSLPQTPLWRLWIGLICMACLPLSSFATHDGPEHVEIWGYEPIDQKIYYHAQYYDEFEHEYDLFYILLDDPRKTYAPIPVYSMFADSPEAQRIKARLQPLIPTAHANQVQVKQLRAAPAPSLDEFGEIRPQHIGAIYRLSFQKSANMIQPEYIGDQIPIIQHLYRIPNRSEYVAQYSYGRWRGELTHEAQSIALLTIDAPSQIEDIHTETAQAELTGLQRILSYIRVWLSNLFV